MKKLIIGGLAILLALSLVVIACDGGIGGDFEDDGYTYNNDGTLASATAYFTNGGLYFPPVKKTSRALSDSIAKSSYNLFEVVFVSGGEAVRTSWEYGGSALIQGVDVDSAAIVDYAGNAVLFIGKKETMQLLAVGVITHVNGVAGTELDVSSRTVTFTVSSLEAGVWAESIGIASGAGANIGDVTFTEGGTIIGNFPALVLNAITAPDLDYTFKFKATDAANDADRFAAIKSVAANPKIYSRDPLFFSTATGNPVIQVTATAALSTGTVDTLVPVTAGGALITSTTVLGVTTGTMAITPQLTLAPLAGGVTPTKGLFSVGFKIPVFALSDDNTLATLSNAPKQWYVATGADENFLDTGSFLSPGGQILVFLGATADAGSESVEIKKSTSQNGLYVVFN